MRNLIDIHAAKLFSNKEMRLLMLGLDAAGKTSTTTEQRVKVEPCTH
jgi:GTPase SAR1 family protein